MHTSSDWLLPLDDNRCSDPELVGGKASQLHALIKDDFPVPQAWVLTQAAFDGHFPDASAVETPDRPMLQMLVQASLREVAEELLTGATSYLAVRSSALAEDGVDHSYAGQHATYYYVTADSLGKAVIDCWLSLWSDAASAYRAQVPYQTLFGMPIIIQQMVPAERSGVCFTRDPTGRHPQQMLIEASWGLGAALVDGRVSPDRYRLDADLNLTDQQIGQKRLKVVADLSNPDGSRLEGVPVHQQTKPVLSPSTPADITGRWVLFKPIVENISQPLTPLTVDLFRRVLPPIGQFIQGRYYLNADLLKLLIPADLDDSVLQDLLMLRPVDPKPPLNWRRLPKTLGLLIGSYLSFGISWHRTARVPLERLSDFTERCESVVADETQNPLTILSALFLNRNPLAPISQLAFQVNISAGRYFLLTDLLTRLLNKWAPDFDQRNHLALLTSGGEAMISQQMVEAVKDLAKLASDDPETRALLLDDPIPDTGSVLHNLDPDQPFARAFTGFLERFGHRAIGEIELMTPRWREDASAVVQMVRNLLKQEGLPAAVDPHGLRLAAQDTLHQALPELWQRKLIDWLLTWKTSVYAA
jgi:hypothetical protein